jgi:hypothetical protein
MKTETTVDGNQSGSQSVSRETRPNCYECKHRASLVGDAHSECKHPRISEVDRIITGFAILSGQKSQAMKRLNITADPTGIRGGWFWWPLNFDPAWLLTCDGFESKKARFDKTFCSQCGSEFGPGEHGYSDCKSHRKKGVARPMF